MLGCVERLVKCAIGSLVHRPNLSLTILLAVPYGREVESEEGGEQKTSVEELILFNIMSGVQSLSERRHTPLSSSSPSNISSTPLGCKA